MKIYHGSIEKVESPKFAYCEIELWTMDMVFIPQHPTIKQRIG